MFMKLVGCIARGCKASVLTLDLNSRLDTGSDKRLSHAQQCGTFIEIYRQIFCTDPKDLCEVSFFEDSIMTICIFSCDRVSALS